MAALGGILLVVALVAPIDWFKEVSSGGLSGDGTGEPPRYLSAWEEFGLWSVLVGAAGVAGIAALWTRAWPGRVGASVIAVGVLTLAVALLIANAGSTADSPDQIYEATRVEEGSILAALGAALVSGGAVGCAMARRERID